VAGGFRRHHAEARARARSHRVHFGEEIEEALVEHVGSGLELAVAQPYVALREPGAQLRVQPLGQILQVVLGCRLRLGQSGHPVAARRLVVLSPCLAHEGALVRLVAHPRPLRLCRQKIPLQADQPAARLVPPAQRLAVLAAFLLSAASKGPPLGRLLGAILLGVTP
jgi:hypothetical protein